MEDLTVAVTKSTASVNVTPSSLVMKCSQHVMHTHSPTHAQTHTLSLSLTHTYEYKKQACASSFMVGFQLALVVRAGNEFICLNVFVCLLKQKQTDINQLRGTNREPG